jgi:hypothetical protein
MKGKHHWVRSPWLSFYTRVAHVHFGSSERTKEISRCEEDNIEKHCTLTDLLSDLENMILEYSVPIFPFLLQLFLNMLSTNGSSRAALMSMNDHMSQHSSFDPWRRSAQARKITIFPQLVFLLFLRYRHQDALVDVSETRNSLVWRPARVRFPLGLL